MRSQIRGDGDGNRDLQTHRRPYSAYQTNEVVVVAEQGLDIEQYAVKAELRDQQPAEVSDIAVKIGVV